MNLATTQYQQNARGNEREDLIMENMDYVRKILSTMTVNVDDEDTRQSLYSAGVVGLVEAANSFDSSRGISFRTFSYPRIRGAIVDELRKFSPVSQEVLRQIGIIKNIYQQFDPPVTPELLARESGFTLEQVMICLEAMRFLAPQNWNDLHCTIHSSWQSQEDSPERLVERSEMESLLADGVETLPEKERLIFTLYYVEELTLVEIGEVINLSESRVSRLLGAAKFRLGQFIKQQTGVNDDDQ
ncbi:MAG: sigma-70 family RNA polymerase sigma factor [Planctomycetota bacterium]